MRSSSLVEAEEMVTLLTWIMDAKYGITVTRLERSIQLMDSQPGLTCTSHMPAWNPIKGTIKS
jgi:hypothetical protein